MNKLKLFGFFVLIIVIVGVVAFRQKTVYHTEISAFTMTAQGEDPNGISPDTHFLLYSSADLSPQVIAKYVKITPEARFSVKKVESALNTVEIIPEENLVSDKVYNIEIEKGPLASHDYSWAYQVKAPFQLISAVPKDHGTQVPTNTGIELEFNREGISNPTPDIAISPYVGGRFEVAGNKVRFIPTNPLEEATVYTVTIGPGLQVSGSDDTLGTETKIQFETAKKQVSADDYGVSFGRSFVEFNTGSELVFSVVAPDKPTADATVYRFKDAQEFIDSYAKVKGGNSWAYYMTDLDGKLSNYTRVYTGTVPLERQKSRYGYDSYLHIPQELPAGYYAVIAGPAKGQGITWFQINPGSSYSAISSQNSLIWLKDITTGKNLSGIPITYNGTRVGMTGNDGVALFNTPRDLISTTTDYYYSTKPRQFFVAELPTPVVIPVENEYGYNGYVTQESKWWDYISLNKPVYLPTDTIHFWSLLKAREGDISGQEVTVKLSTPYWDSRTTAVTYAETKVKVSDFGAVTGDLSYSNLTPSSYELTFSKGDEIISRQLISVGAYIKPAYKIDLEPVKTSVFAGDPVSFNVKAEFFDGTPVSNIDLNFSTYSEVAANKSGTVHLDQEGKGSFSFDTQYRELSYSSWPSYFQVSVGPSKSEEADISASATVLVFGPHISTDIQQTENGSTAIFNLKTREISLGNGKRLEPYWTNDAYLGNPVSGMVTTAVVSEIIYFKEQTATGYDPISKTTYPIYNYHTDYQEIQTVSVKSDINGNAQVVLPLDSKKNYKVKFTSTDAVGHTTTSERYVYSGFNYATDLSDDYYYPVSDYYASYKLGDQYTVKVQNSEGAKPVPSSGNFIFLKVNNGKITYSIQDSPDFTSTYQASDIPNVAIWPGWFSGGRFHSSSMSNISFDANERRLKIAVIKDKDTYKPGEKVTLDLKVTDKNNNPVRAEVNLSALDEAVFSISPEERDIVNAIYKDIYSTLLVRTSNMPPMSSGGAEKGGGGDDAPRSKLEEMALFKTIETDGSGSAHLDFTLPDNITSWRLTTQAVTKDLFAGKALNFIPVTLPFFVDATLNKTYLEGDDLVVRLRTFGTGSTNAAVTYTVESPTLDFKKAQKTGGNEIEFDLGKLTAGTHDLTIRVNDGTHKDALTRTITALPSYFTKQSSDFYEGTQGLSIRNKALGYTTLVFSPLGRGQVYSDLWNLRCGCGPRIDQKGAAVAATKLLNTYFDQKLDAPDFSIDKYFDSYNGIQLLPYSDGDLEMSALAAHTLDLDPLKQATLKSYFTRSLTDEKSDIHRISQSLYGLSAFGEPVLTKIQTILSSGTALDFSDRTYLALALDSLGAKEQARAVYEGKIKPYLETTSSYVFFKGGDDKDVIATALLAALATRLDIPEAPKMYLYVKDHPPKETLVNFEKILYLKDILSKLGESEVTFSYSAGGKNGTETLKNNDTFTLTLSPQELAQFNLSGVSGKLGIVSSYVESSAPNTFAHDKELSLEREYSLNNVISSTEFNEGDLVKVRLTPSYTSRALVGPYEIVDYLPSGMRFADNEATSKFVPNYSERIYPIEVDDQKVTFITDSNWARPIYYYARVVSKGVYKAEPATLQSMRNLDSITTSNAQSITIK
jgi:hypothetical protein